MKKRMRLLCYLLIFLFLFSIIVQGCVNNNSSAITTSFSPSATYTLIQFPTNCPFATPVLFTNHQNKKLVYLLIDRSGSYSKFTQSAINIAISSLEKSLEPGDRIYIVWLGEEEKPEDYLYSGSVPELTDPIILTPINTIEPFSSIAPNLTQTNTITPDSTSSIFKNLGATRTAITANLLEIETQESISKTATIQYYEQEKSIYDIQCLQFNQNEQNKQEIIEWDNNRQEIITNFISNSLNPLSNPKIEKYDKGTHIYNNLYIASKIIQTEKESHNFSTYYLLIFSDMEDIGSNKGEKLDIDLQNINILVPMMYCKDSIQCQDREIYWSDYFSSRGALLPINPFRLIQETTSDSISDFLKNGG